MGTRPRTCAVGTSRREDTTYLLTPLCVSQDTDGQICFFLPKNAVTAYSVRVLWTWVRLVFSVRGRCSPTKPQPMHNWYEDSVRTRPRPSGMHAIAEMWTLGRHGPVVRYNGCVGTVQFEKIKVRIDTCAIDDGTLSIPKPKRMRYALTFRYGARRQYRTTQ